MSCRKRRRLEDLPHSQTVEKFADLIGRGKISIDAAATIARSFVARLMFFTEQRLKNPPVLGGPHFSFKPSSRFENNRLCGRWPTLRGSRTKRFAPLDRLAPMDAVRRTKKGTYTRGSDICGVFLWKHMWCPWDLEASWFWHGVSVFLCFIVCVKTSQPLIGWVSHGLLRVNGWRSKPRSTPVHVLLPHEVIHCLATKSMSAFQSIMLGDLSDDARRNFWEVTKGLEPWKDHPIHTSDAPYHRLIPCAIHADGAQFYRDDEFYVWSWSSLWGGQGDGSRRATL